MATPDYIELCTRSYKINSWVTEKENLMREWRWEHQRDGRMLRLYLGNRLVLTIDGTRLLIQDKVGRERFDRIVGAGKTPTLEDEQLILNLLNGAADSREIEEVAIGKIFGEILEERKHQDEAWGADHDDGHTVNDWIVFINRYVSRTAEMDTTEAQRAKLVKVAALTVAAIEAFDRNDGFPPRHYDET